MSRVTFPLPAAIAGFCVGIAMGGYAFYLTSHREIGNSLLLVVLSPPSILAMALDNAGTVGALVGWLFIAFVNAGLYALLWAILPFRRVQNSHHD